MSERDRVYQECSITMGAQVKKSMMRPQKSHPSYQLSLSARPASIKSLSRRIMSRRKRKSIKVAHQNNWVLKYAI